jgi:hypothetical protein
VAEARLRCARVSVPDDVRQFTSLRGPVFLYHFQSEFLGFFEACQVVASRDLTGKFARGLLSESPVRTALIVLPVPAL